MKCRTTVGSEPQGSISAPILATTRAADSFTEVTREMVVAGRRLDLGVPQQLADHRQALAEGKGPAGEAVALIPDSE